VRRLIQLAVIALGIRALLRWRKRRRAEAEPVTTAPTAADPADELRQRLAESRTESAVDDTPATPDATVEDRRADVHEQGRATLDDIKSSGDEG
jgi:hypothetical protein